jgi:hypothetical protein
LNEYPRIFIIVLLQFRTKAWRTLPFGQQPYVSTSTLIPGSFGGQNTFALRVAPGTTVEVMLTAVDLDDEALLETDKKPTT